MLRRCCTILLFIFLFSTVYPQKKINVDSIVASWNLKNEYDIDFLADTLTSSFHDDSLKMRAIFFWITDNIAYDWDKLRAMLGGKRLKEKDLDEDQRLYKEIWKTVKKKKGICQDYADLFAYMCNEVHIPCVVITGNATENKLLLKLRSPDSKHAWSAVMIHGKWQFIDATWASGYVNKKGRFTKHRNEYYYFTPPEELIKSHRPTDEKWTFLPIPDTFARSFIWSM